MRLLVGLLLLLAALPAWAQCRPPLDAVDEKIRTVRFAKGEKEMEVVYALLTSVTLCEHAGDNLAASRTGDPRSCTMRSAQVLRRRIYIVVRGARTVVDEKGETFEVPEIVEHRAQNCDATAKQDLPDYFKTIRDASDPRLRKIIRDQMRELVRLAADLGFMPG